MLIGNTKFDTQMAGRVDYLYNSFIKSIYLSLKIRHYHANFDRFNYEKFRQYCSPSIIVLCRFFIQVPQKYLE